MDRLKMKREKYLLVRSILFYVFWIFYSDVSNSSDMQNDPLRYLRMFDMLESGMLEFWIFKIWKFKKKT